MSVTLSVIATLAIFAPFIIEAYAAACAGKPAYRSIGTTFIVMAASHLVLLFAAGLVGIISRPVSVIISLAIATAWCTFRRAWITKLFDQARQTDILHFSMTFLPVVGVVVISSFALAHVHFGYTGQMVRINSIENVYEAETLRPYYSDEWIIAGMVKGVITDGSLPIAHPFTPDLPYVNVLLPFALLVTHFFLIYGLDPIEAFAYAPLVMGVVLILSAYLMARRAGAWKLAAAVATLTLLFVTNGSNVAGLWYLIPVHAGIVGLVAVFLSYEESSLIRWLGFALTVALYQPSAVLVVPLAILLSKTRRERILIVPICVLESTAWRSTK